MFAQTTPGLRSSLEVTLLTFVIDGEDEKRLGDWLGQHEETCRFSKPGANVGAIGGSLSYQFTPTAIGTIAKVSCACGESVSLCEDL